MTRSFTLIALAVTLGSVAAHAQASGDAATRDTIARLADSLRAAGLPAEPLLAKAAEGRLKGADDARILRAVRALARELGEARSALPASASTATIVAAASAIHAGVRADDVRRVVTTRGASDGDMGVALVTLADLVASRVPPSDAVAAIANLLERRATEGDMTALRLGVAQDVGAGRAPAEAVQTRARVLVDRLDTRPGEPRAPVRPPVSPTGSARSSP